MILQKRYFTLATANKSLMWLHDRLVRLIQLQTQIKQLFESLSKRGRIPTKSNTSEIIWEAASSDMKHDLLSLKLLINEMSCSINELGDLGFLLRDLETYIVDVLSKKNNRDVYLSWRFGEKHFAYWREINEDLLSRRQIESNDGFSDMIFAN